MTEVYFKKPNLIRTLSNQHWQVASQILLENDLLEYEAGRQLNWRFVIERENIFSKLVYFVTYKNNKSVFEKQVQLE